jgi:hypothetical protein
MRQAFRSSALALVLVAAVAGTAGAQGQGLEHGRGPDGEGPPGQLKKQEPALVAATPELDSVVLFGTGALALAGYLLTRRRAAK